MSAQVRAGFLDPYMTDAQARCPLESGDEPWVTNAEVRHHMPDGAPIWQKYPHASDHYPVSVTVTT